MFDQFKEEAGLSEEKIPSGNTVNPAEFEHELTQIYLELKGEFTKQHLAEKYPTPEIARQQLNPSTQWEAEAVKYALPAAQQVSLAQVQPYKEESTFSVAVSEVPLVNAGITTPQAFVAPDVNKNTPKLNCPAINTKWEDQPVNWDCPASATVVTASITEVEPVSVNLKTIPTFSVVQANTEYTADSVSVKQSFSANKVVAKISNVPTLEPDKNTELFRVTPIIANVTVEPIILDSVSFDSVNIEKAHTEWTPELVSAPITGEPIYVSQYKYPSYPSYMVFNIGTKEYPVMIAKTDCDKPDLTNWSTPSVDLVPAIDSLNKDTSICVRNMSVPSTTPVVNVTVPTVKCEAENDLSALSQLKNDEMMNDFTIMQAEIASISNVSMVSDEFYVDVSLVSTEVSLPEIEKTNIHSVNCTTAKLTTVPDYTENDFAIPNMQVEIPAIPEPPDLHLPVRRQSEPEVDITMMDAAAIWKAIGGIEAFAKDGINFDN